MRQHAPRRLLTGAAIALFATPALIGGIAAPAHAEVTSSTFQNYSAPNGLSSQYHVYADGIDWSKPVGAVFYLDGDYWTTNQSKVYDPNNADMKAMAQVAAEHNMVFVPVISPDKDASGDGITWWQDQDANGDYLRSFIQDFTKTAGIDPANIWTLGYSGGAEISTFEMNADRQDQWRTGGGSIMVGGGNSNGMQTAPSAAAKAVALDWYAGEKDGTGVTWPQDWSALGAAQSGKAVYDGSGFTNTKMNIIPGIDHYGYDFGAILAQSLQEAGVATVGDLPATAPVKQSNAAAGDQFSVDLAKGPGGDFDVLANDSLPNKVTGVKLVDPVSGAAVDSYSDRGVTFSVVPGSNMVHVAVADGADVSALVKDGARVTYRVMDELGESAEAAAQFAFVAAAPAPSQTPAPTQTPAPVESAAPTVSHAPAPAPSQAPAPAPKPSQPVSVAPSVKPVEVPAPAAQKQSAQQDVSQVSSVESKQVSADHVVAPAVKGGSQATSSAESHVSSVAPTAKQGAERSVVAQTAVERQQGAVVSVLAGAGVLFLVAIGAVVASRRYL